MLEIKTQEQNWKLLYKSLNSKEHLILKIALLLY